MDPYKNAEPQYMPGVQATTTTYAQPPPPPSSPPPMYGAPPPNYGAPPPGYGPPPPGYGAPPPGFGGPPPAYPQAYGGGGPPMMMPAPAMTVQRIVVGRRLKCEAWVFIIIAILFFWPAAFIPCCISGCYEDIYEDVAIMSGNYGGPAMMR